MGSSAVATIQPFVLKGPSLLARLGAVLKERKKPPYTCDTCFEPVDHGAICQVCMAI